MDRAKKYPEWGNLITKEHTWYPLTDKWILAQKLGIPKIQFTEDMKLRMKENQNVGASVLLRKGTKYSPEQIGRQVWSRDWRKGHPKTAPPGDSFHTQSTNPDSIVDLKKCMLTGTWYSCLQRGSFRSWQIQRLMLAANHWTDQRVPSGEAREMTEGAEGLWPHTKININQSNPSPLKAPRY
jgi:hypothetical protein